MSPGATTSLRAQHRRFDTGGEFVSAAATQQTAPAAQQLRLRPRQWRFGGAVIGSSSGDTPGTAEAKVIETVAAVEAVVLVAGGPRRVDLGISRERYARRRRDRPVRAEARVWPNAQGRATPAMHEMHSVQAVVEMGTGMLIQASDVQYVKFEGSAPADWSISSAFHDTGALKPQQKEQFTLLLDSAEMGGIALSVEGDDDEDQINGHSEDDRASHADELAISMVLEGPRQFALIGA